MLCAIVVSQNHVKDGSMDQASFDGFCMAAAALRLHAVKPIAFLKQEAAVFSAAEEGGLP